MRRQNVTLILFQALVKSSPTVFCFTLFLKHDPRLLVVPLSEEKIRKTRYFCPLGSHLVLEDGGYLLLV